MHCLYFVKVEKDQARSAEQAIDRAQSILDDNGFAGADGYWGGAKCDWFVIGGRWSGVFSGLRVKGDFHEEARKLVLENSPSGEEREFPSSADYEKHAEKIQELWRSLGGRGFNPYARDQYKSDGYHDDAINLTSENIALIKEKYGEHVEYYDHEAFDERHVSWLSEKDAGGWLVVVDYHY
jgi:hypothetical protein